MMPVMWGMAMILVGVTAFMMQKPSGMDYMWSLLIWTRNIDKHMHILI